MKCRAEEYSRAGSGRVAKSNRTSTKQVMLVLVGILSLLMLRTYMTSVIKYFGLVRNETYERKG